MIDVAQACRAAEEFIRGNLKAPEGDQLAVIEELTKDAGDGWYIFWQSARYLETRDHDKYFLVGTSPVFVTKSGVVEGFRRWPATEK